MISRLQNLNNWHVFYILVFITLTTSIASAFLNPGLASKEWWSGFLQNFSTEMMGAIATFGLFELVIEVRRREEDKQEAIEKEKVGLIIQMRSTDNATVVMAIDRLRANGWLEDGSLKNINLREANLSGVILEKANLSGANLREASLEGARLWLVDMSEANLRETNMSKAWLSRANLSDSHLRFANLAEADLESVNLTGAFLNQAKLTGANLVNANLRHSNMYSVKCDESTTLPDGTGWTVDTDWTHFGGVMIEDWSEWEAYRKEQELD